MDGYCIGCGEKIDLQLDNCPHCQTKTCGENCREKICHEVDVENLPDLRSPDICCCCQRPMEVIEKRNAKLYKIKMGLSRTVLWAIPIPWCKPCRKVETSNKITYAIAVFLTLTVGLPLGFAIAYFFSKAFLRWDEQLTSSGLMMMVFFGIIISLIFVMSLYSLFDKHIARREPGHVRSCRGILGIMADVPENARNPQKQVEIFFGSKAFAKKWRELNPF